MQASPCCCEPKNVSVQSRLSEIFNSKKAYEVATQVARFAIGLFGIVMSPLAFAGAFAVGTIAGALYYRQNKEMPEALETQPVCARGYAEMLGQAKFPSIVNLGITSITILACISCHTAFYAPFAGFFVGFYVGQKAGEQIFSIQVKESLVVKPFLVDVNKV